MELYVNGKTFSITEKMQKAFEKAVSLSRRDNCLEIYVKDEADSSFDAIVLADPTTQEFEILYVPFLNDAVNEKCFDYKKLFLNSMIKTGSISDVKCLSLSEMLSMNKSQKLNLRDMYVELQNGTLFVYVPNGNSYKSQRKTSSSFKKEALEYAASENVRLLAKVGKTTHAKEAPTSQKEPLKQENFSSNKKNVFTKTLTHSEKRQAVVQYVGKNDDCVLLYAPLNKAMYRVDKMTGEAKSFTIQSIMDNPNLGITSADDILSLGIFDLSVKHPFKSVSCCDMRTAFPHFKNPDAIVSGVNYTVDNNVLYIVFAHPETVSKAISLKDFSIECYTKTGSLWEQIEEKFDSYDKKVFYVHRNNLPDCIALCDEKGKTSEFKPLEYVANELENFSLVFNSDLSVGFPKDRIFDLNEYGTDDVKLIRFGSMNVINACNFKTIRDDDEISTGYDKKNNVCFYCMPQF